MTEHEKLIEAYEDALFAVLMEEVAQSEGNKLLELNDQLKTDPGAAVPEALHAKSMKTIQEEFKKRSFKNMGRTSKKIFRNIALVAAITLLLFTTAFAVSEQVRVYTYNAIITAFDEYSLFNFGDSNPKPQQNNRESSDEVLTYYYNIALQYLPNGYEVSSGYTSPFDSVCFSNNEGHVIGINVIPYSSTAVFQFDTEDSEQRQITVKDTSATMYSKFIDNTPGVEPYMRRIILWFDDQRQIAIFARATDLPEAELIRVVEGVVWNDVIP